MCVVAPFQVTVNAFNGPSYTVWTRSNETIVDIKLKLAMQVGVLVEQQRLVFQGKALEEVQTIAASIVLITAVDRKKVCTHALLPNSSMLVMYNKVIVCMGYALVVECVDMWVITCLSWVCSCPNNVCRSQATPPQQAPPTSHQSMSLQSSILAPVEVVLPLHISHVVLCEGFGAQALELLLSFLYTGSVDINEGSPYVSLAMGLCCGYR